MSSVKYIKVGGTTYNVSRLHYGECATAAATVDKVVTSSTFTSDDLVAGSVIMVKNTTKNTGAVASLTLNVNNTGAKAIKKVINAAVGNLTNAGEFLNTTLMFVYDGTYWILSNVDYNSTYGTMSQAEASAGTVTTGRVITSKVLVDTITEKITSTVATTTTAGSMSASDKTKLDGIASGAEVNQNAFSNIKVGNTTVAADTKTDTVEFVGSNVTITPDATNDKVTFGITKDNVTTALGYTPPSSTSDTKVTQTVSDSSNANYPILIKNTAATATITDASRFSSKVTLNPSTGNLTVVSLNGGTVPTTGAKFTDTTYTAGTGLTLSGTTFSVSTVPLANGGTGITTNPSMLVNLGSSTAASVFAASPRPGVTGTLPLANGGTGATTAAAARTNLGLGTAATMASTAFAASSHTHDYSKVTVTASQTTGTKLADITVNNNGTATTTALYYTNTTYSALTSAIIKTGTETTAKLITGKVASDALTENTFRLYGGTPTSNTDLNTYVTPGSYYCSTSSAANTFTNNPYSTSATTSLTAFRLYVVAGTGTSSYYAYQILREYNKPTEYRRFSSNASSTTPTWSAWANTNTDTYPTGLTWTNGTSSGPVPNISRAGSTTTAIVGSAIPVASTTTSGVVTTNYQEISGQKMFYGVDESNYATVYFINKSARSVSNAGVWLGLRTITTDQNNATNNGYICYFPNNKDASDTVDSNGGNFVMYGSGNMILGGGESPMQLWNSVRSSGGAKLENFYAVADGQIFLEAGANTLANRKGIMISDTGNIYPIAGSAATGAANQMLGSPNYRFSLVAVKKLNVTNYGTTLPTSGIDGGDVFFQLV